MVPFALSYAKPSGRCPTETVPTTVVPLITVTMPAGLGSVTSITNASQDLQTSYRYDPYGVQVQAAGAVPSPLRYTGREWDANDGLEYSRARYYDPTTGRFLSKDPSGSGGTNRYAYVGNNPVV